VFKSRDVRDGSLKMACETESANAFRKKRNGRSMTEHPTRDNRHGQHSADDRFSADNLEKPHNLARMKTQR